MAPAAAPTPVPISAPLPAPYPVPAPTAAPAPAPTAAPPSVPHAVVASVTSDRPITAEAILVFTVFVVIVPPPVCIPGNPRASTREWTPRATTRNWSPGRSQLDPTGKKVHSRRGKTYRSGKDRESHGTARREGGADHRRQQGHRPRPEPPVREGRRRGGLRGPKPRPRGGDGRSDQERRRAGAGGDRRCGDGGRRAEDGRGRRQGLRQARRPREQRGGRRPDQAGAGVHDRRLVLHDQLLPHHLLHVHPLRGAGDDQGGR